MLFKIRHETGYAYSGFVFLEPHIIRLQPRCDSSQRLIRFDLQIEPKPVGLSEYTDQEGNCVANAWFNGLTDSLVVTTTSQVETLRSNPFDYIITDPSALALPMIYPDELKPHLAPYCSYATPDDSVLSFAESIASEVKRQTLEFLTALSHQIYEMCRQTIREEGNPKPPEETLSQRKGSCRDLAVLFIDSCRAVGIAARFVSGYQEGDPDQEKKYLHAWAEVYLPGGGWRGYDPTHGLAVSDRHVAMAASVTPRGAAPIIGTLRCTGKSSTLHTDINIQVCSGMCQ
jgi:transglutaminase-like putative cysteine protease